IDALLALADKRSCKIVINSGGGSVYASLAIATVIKLKQLAAEALVLADCSSAAITVFAACPIRKVSPYASFLFHPVKWASEDQSRLTGAKAWAIEFERVNQIYEDFLIAHMGVKRSIIRSWIKEEKYVTAQEIIDLGIADPIEFPEDGVIDISKHRRHHKVATPHHRQVKAKIRKVG
ncbi:MAG: ATP-dependent Clp protease proteolytic subunit, partial [Candidatus Sumerlaeota bacterium]